MIRLADHTKVVFKAMAFNRDNKQAQHPGTLSAAGRAVHALPYSTPDQHDAPVTRTSDSVRQAPALCIPSGWPSQVAAPGTEQLESDASGFLFDCCPAEYRGYELLRRDPVILARFAADQVAAQLKATNKTLSQARVELGDVVTPSMLDQVVCLLQQERARLIRLARAVALVEQALRGKVFMRKL